ncbi:MAG: hypothetical protein ACLP9L_05760 [Thermoguttaceae bacterium]
MIPSLRRMVLLILTGIILLIRGIDLLLRFFVFGGLLLLPVGVLLSFCAVPLTVMIFMSGMHRGLTSLDLQLVFYVALAPATALSAFMFFFGYQNILYRKMASYPDLPAPSEGWIGGYQVNVTEACELDDQRYEVFFNLPAVKGSPKPKQSSLTIRVRAPMPLILQFQAEDWFDVLCKRVGLASEFKTGDTAFDDRIYIRGLSSEYVQPYLAKGTKREAVLALTQLGCSEVEITSDGVKAIWRGFHPVVDGRPLLAEQAAALLRVLATDLPPTRSGECIPASDLRSRRQFYLIFAEVLYALLLLLVFAHPPVRGLDLLLSWLALSIPLYLALGWLAVFLLRGTLTSHGLWTLASRDRWKLVMFVGLATVSMGSLGAVAGLNTAFDRQPLTEHNVLISKVGVNVDRGKQGATNAEYFAVAADWDHPKENVEFRLSREDRSRLQVGKSQMHVVTGPGWLGIEWLKDARLMPE